MSSATPKRRHWKRWLVGFLFLLLAIFVAQVMWMDACLENSREKPNVDAVVVFTGEIGRIRSGARLTRETFARYLLVTRDQRRFVEGLIKRSGGLNGATLFVDETYATTTDGNARYAAPLLRDLGVQDVLLVSDWYHLPRSRFLLRSYLGGDKIKIHTYPAHSIPERPWSYPQMQMELFKMWGSVLRVALQWVGIEDWPRNSGGLKSRVSNAR